MELEQRGPRPGNEQRIMREKPELDDVTALCARCWNRLRSCRLRGFSGYAAIPWTAIDAFANREHLDDEVSELLFDVIMKTDNNHAASEASKAALARKGQPR